MRTKFIALLVGLLLAVGATIALPASPAAADNYNATTYWHCAVHRPYADATVEHSWPDAMGTGWLRVWCSGDFWQWWVIIYTNGTSVRPYPYQRCWPAPGWVTYCGTAGH